MALRLIKERYIPMNAFAFVGERPSVRAMQIGASWENGRLAGKTLRDTLDSLGIDPDGQCYLNLYKMPRKSERDLRDEGEAIMQIRRLQTDGYVIVGMGKIVCRRLETYRIPHLQLTHPAARGSIRRTEHYRAHARSILFETSQLDPVSS
jgi:hypothetical protein